MQRFPFVAAALVACALPIACAKPASAPAPGKSAPATSADDPPVARLASGEEIRANEFDAWVREDLLVEAMRGRTQSQVYAFQADALRRMQLERLLEREADARGISGMELYEEVSAKAPPVGDDQVRAVYDARKAQFGGRSYEEVAEPLRRRLEEQSRGETWNAYLDGLLASQGFTLLIDRPRATVDPIGPSLGPESAPVTIVAFTDYECPYCRRAEPVVAEVLDRYGDRVRLVVRQFPLDMHPNARAAAEAAACARAQGRFFEYHAALFAEPKKLTKRDLLDRARDNGLDVVVFERCIAGGQSAGEVEIDIAAGRELQVKGTPVFFVNGIRLEGVQPVEAFAEIIDAELGAAPASGSPQE